jgi:hypothetical protein
VSLNSPGQALTCCTALSPLPCVCATVWLAHPCAFSGFTTTLAAAPAGQQAWIPQGQQRRGLPGQQPRPQRRGRSEGRGGGPRRLRHNRL